MKQNLKSKEAEQNSTIKRANELEKVITGVLVGEFSERLKEIVYEKGFGCLKKVISF